MSDIIKKTEQLIAEAEALLARAQKKVEEGEAQTREVAKDPVAWRLGIERDLGPHGAEHFARMVDAVQDRLRRTAEEQMLARSTSASAGAQEPQRHSRPRPRRPMV